MSTTNLSPRKLIYLADMRLPTDWAHGIQIMKMCEAFSTHQFKVELVVPRRFNKIKQDPWQYYGLAPKFKIVKLPCLDLMPLGALKLTFLLEKFSFFLSARAYLWFKQYDILYTREALSSWLFRRHVLELHVIPGQVRNWQRWLWRRPGKIVALTAIMKQVLRANGVRRKIIVAPDGVDLEQFSLSMSQEEARRQLNLPLDQHIVMYTGSIYLYDWKGVDVLLAAAEFLSSDTVIILVGGSETEIKTLKQNIKTDNVMLIGRQPHNSIPLYLRAADVLVLPNKSGAAHSEQYTSPLKLFEYMASDRPIVASDLPALREILNERNAALVAPDSSAAIAGGVKQVLSEPAWAERLARQARQDARQYSWLHRAEIIAKFITNN